MTNVSFSINKSNVLNEVAKTTAYSGAKMVGDEGAYERIFATASDKEMLERFWTECQISVCETLKKFLSAEETTQASWDIWLGAGIIIGIGATTAIIWIWRKRKKPKN